MGSIALVPSLVVTGRGTAVAEESTSMHRTALFSPCGTFRYRLGRRWSEGRTVAFVLLNPSGANEHVDDQTVRRCVRFAQRDVSAVSMW